jgi:hypothetical protein
VATVPDIDIWRSARILVDKHGADATIVAAMRAAAMINRGRPSLSKQCESISASALWAAGLADVRSPDLDNQLRIERSVSSSGK